MTKTETAKLLAVALSCFPSMMEKDMKLVAAGWHTMLGDLDFPIAQAALQKVLATAKFFPSVAEIREAAVSLQPSGMPDAETAFAEVLKQMQITGYMRIPEWSHPIISQVVDAMWGNWQRACSRCGDDTLVADRAHWLRMYSTLTKRQREDALLPPAVKQLASDLAQRLSLPAKTSTNEGDDSDG